MFNIDPKALERYWAANPGMLELAAQQNPQAFANAAPAPAPVAQPSSGGGGLTLGPGDPNSYPSGTAPAPAPAPTPAAPTVDMPWYAAPQTDGRNQSLVTGKTWGEMNELERAAHQIARGTADPNMDALLMQDANAYLDNLYGGERAAKEAELRNAAVARIGAREGTDSERYLEALAARSIYEGGTVYDPYEAGGHYTADFGTEIGLSTRPDVTGTEYEQYYLPHRPTYVRPELPDFTGMSTEEIQQYFAENPDFNLFGQPSYAQTQEAQANQRRDLEAWHQYYNDNPQLRALLSVDEQVELTYLDERTGAITPYEQEQRVKAIREAAGLPRKTGIPGHDSEYAFAYDVKAKRETDDPYADLIKHQEKIGTYGHRRSTSDGFFGDILKDVGNFLDSDLGKIIVTGLNFIPGVGQAAATAIQALNYAQQASNIAGDAGLLDEDKAKVTDAVNDYVAVMQDVYATEDEKAEVAGDILGNIDNILRDAVLDDRIDAREAGGPEAPPYEEQERPWIGGTQVENPEGGVWVKDSTSVSGWRVEPVDPNEDGGGGAGGDPNDTTDAPPRPPGGVVYAPGPEAPPQGAQVDPNHAPREDEVWRHENPDGTVVAGNETGEVWEVEPEPEGPGGEGTDPEDELILGPGDILGDLEDIFEDTTEGVDTIEPGDGELVVGPGPGTSPGTTPGDDGTSSDPGGELVVGPGPGPTPTTDPDPDPGETPDGTNGKDGEDGKDGKDGEDGITEQVFGGGGAGATEPELLDLFAIQQIQRLPPMQRLQALQKLQAKIRARQV